MRRRLDAGLVMQAADDVLVLSQKPEKQKDIEKEAKEGKRDYNKDEFVIGKEATENLITKEMQQGKVDKYILKMMADPKQVPYWDQTKFVALKKSAEAMAQVRKEIQQAKREARLRQEAEEAGLDANEEAKSQELQNVLIFDVNEKLKDGQLLSESEQEEVDEMFLGKDTTQALAEFKARALNKMELADKIRGNKLTHEQLLQFI